MAQNDRKLYDSLFQLRVRAFDRSLQHRGGGGVSEREEGLLRLSPVQIRFYLPPGRRSERRTTDFPWKIVLGAIKGQRQSPRLMTFAQPTQRDICTRALRFTVAHTVDSAYDSRLCFRRAAACGPTFRDKNNTLLS